jgi:hypothetical protein
VGCIIAVLGFALGLLDLFSGKPRPWGPLAWVMFFFGIMLWAIGI